MGSRFDPVGLPFVLFETWLVPVEDGSSINTARASSSSVGGIPRHRMGDHAEATSSTAIIRHDIAGIGAGGLYGTCVGNALKWFPDKRGLAAVSPPPVSAQPALKSRRIQADDQRTSGFQTTFPIRSRARHHHVILGSSVRAEIRTIPP